MTKLDFQTHLQTILPHDQWEDFWNTCYRPLKKSLTINPVKISKQEFEQYACDQWWTLQAHPYLADSTTYYIDRDDTSIALGNHWMHQCGLYYIQELAAATAAPLLEVSPGSIVLDMSASPGGKSAQLASRLLCAAWDAWPWLLISNDVDQLRIRTLQENLARMGVRNGATTKIDGTKIGQLYPEYFDAILVDAPCSGEGTAFKSSEVYDHRTISDIKKIVGLQTNILISAIKALKVWGSLIYSTCTLNTLENEGVLTTILEQFSECMRLQSINRHICNPWILVAPDLAYSKDTIRLRPHVHHTGGFFISKLTKVAPYGDSTSLHQSSQQNRNNSIDAHKTKRIRTYMEEYYGLAFDPKHYILSMQGDDCYLSCSEALHTPVHLMRHGIKIGKYIRDTWIPHHFLGCHWWHTATRSVLDITDVQAQQYVHGESIDGNALWFDIAHPFALLRRRGTWIGVVKRVQGERKSKFSLT